MPGTPATRSALTPAATPRRLNPPATVTARRGGVLHPFSGFTLSVSQTQVESRGSVHIASTDPHAPPAIRYNYLATENDRRVMVDGLKFIRRIAATAPLRDYVAAEATAEPWGVESVSARELTPRILPGAEHLARAPHRLSGRVQVGGQEQFYLEGQIALAVPREGGDMLVYSSTQHPTEVQHRVARVLGREGELRTLLGVHEEVVRTS